MKKTLFVGLLAAAIMALSFTGCKNNPDLGTAPAITDACFVTEADDNNINYIEDLAGKRQTTLHLKSTAYKFYCLATDNEQDIKNVLLSFSTNPTLENSIYWTLNTPNSKKNVWGVLGADFTGDDKESDRLNMVCNNATLYVKAIDSMGNESNIFQLQNITIIND